ncbi:MULTISPECIES: EAL domain-containing protein [unclassified Solwaraspora]|uniref:putative bifunctional diguanylate cyclase/phosphodiesterase n=1 Tax=unclassified Solwaraspora TaxID=2627926 RepID=UPI00248CBC86|nr:MULTISPECIES: EAL domain-containing protein [unclassified Solwaraspora]WBB97963.1 EAL domain-containing protein [Solwaraspora sp. WMMA2059]WBC23478.1 EAL domain-containing protein [Solwaraspora sp. WMMA2080]WJK34437.1 EAL domain-containing protein [Solwaraspora sp. WMMA2065]
MSVRKLTSGYATVMILLSAGILLAPGWHPVLWPALGLTSAGGIVFGIRRYRPKRAAAWWSLAAALVMLAAGDTTYAISPGTIVSELCYLTVFVLTAVGLFMLTQGSRMLGDRSRLLDVLTFVCTAVLLAWIFIIGPYITAPGLEPVERSMLAAYALGDLLILAVMIRLLATNSRTPALVLLLVGAAGMLVGDILYGLTTLGEQWQPGGPIELGWLLTYLTWGAAGLHPSMAQLSEPVEIEQGRISRPWAVLLILATMISPSILLVEAMTGRIRDGAMLAITSAVVFALVLSRFGDVLAAHRQTVRREQGLRDACAALVSAADAAQVDHAVRSGLARIVPEGVDHRLVLVLNRTGGVPALASSVWGPSVPATATGTLLPSTAAVRRTRLLRRPALTPMLAHQLGSFPFALLCPLVLPEQRPPGPVPARPRPDALGPRAGVLLVSAETSVLNALRDAIEVLASHATMALERIRLGDEINRRDAEVYFRALVQNSVDIILIVDDGDAVRYASPAVQTVLGRPAPDGGQLTDLVDPPDHGRVLEGLALVRSSGEPHDWPDWRLRHADGSTVQVEVSCRDLRSDRAVRGLVLTLRDVTERRRLEQELTHRAFHDSLTGLANRVLFHDRVQQAVARAQRSGLAVGVLFIDLDDFKVVNDTMGHQAGDELLVAVANRLAATLGSADAAARLGGDEFAALVDDATDPAEVEQAAQRVVAAFAEPFRLAGRMVGGAVSVGVATTSDAGGTDELLRHADLALYVAKGAGKGRWRRYQPALHVSLIRRMELRTALERSAPESDFAVVYQPIIELASGNAVGLEALLRWRHPSLGLLRPDQFIDVAEETGLIEPIGDWVLGRALAAVSQWRAALPVGEAPYVSINVSARQFRVAGFTGKVRRELIAAGLPANSVMLELTESLLLQNDDQVWSDLAQLRELGVRLAIDDFGTGFSSLSYLRQLPIDVLKIDRSFTAEMAFSQRQRSLVDGIIRLAHSLGLQVVAEGIETVADRNLLGDLGCGYGQGYLFSRPLAEADAVAWLAGGRPVGLPQP